MATPLDTLAIDYAGLDDPALVLFALDGDREAFHQVMRRCNHRLFRTAASLELRAETVKTRSYRARRLLRAALRDSLAATLTDAFPFFRSRCNRITTTVLQRLDSAFAAHGEQDGSKRKN